MKTEILNGVEYTFNSKGNLVPLAAVKDIDVLRSQTIKKISDDLLKLREEMVKVKQSVDEEIKTFLQVSASQYGCNLEGDKGNVSLISYDGLTKVVVAFNDNLTFNENILVAKKLINECLAEWTSSAKEELKILISKAFDLKSGQINVKGILGLRSLNIKDEKWKKAIDIINDSIQIMDSKKYIRLYSKESQDDAFEQVAIDFARV